MPKEPEKQKSREKEEKKREEQPRKPYTRPHLTKFGEVDEFTGQITGISAG
jgi:hypothetical protein